MDTTRPMTRSPLALAAVALRVGKSALPAYSSPFSRQDFTQHQLLALLVLKTFFKTDYRGITQVVAEWAELRQLLQLEKVPHYSTLCYAERRLLKKGTSNRSSIVSSLTQSTEAIRRQPSMRRASKPATSRSTTSDVHK